MGGLLTAAATATQGELDGAFAVGLWIGVIISIFGAVKCALNQRWLLFVLGFFCGFLWIAGWAMGPRRAVYRY